MSTPAFHSLIEDLENLGFDRRNLLKAMDAGALLAPLGCGTAGGSVGIDADGDPSASDGGTSSADTGISGPSDGGSTPERQSDGTLLAWKAIRHG